ncbi:hypothetical protein [Gracilimonas mengyeensis]|uniref:Lipoprotein n=1 Tax=Gracilimonas mengyeensis TaxID=1302730 RepID=A0A521E996_9BACT|nr:hypothetical protein [Gracilimonas mengyeensis]SMO80021.1 hypothetical protein SAMN06265219_1112 [Gracilimonas mengyeensis]
MRTIIFLLLISFAMLLLASCSSEKSPETEAEPPPSALQNYPTFNMPPPEPSSKTIIDNSIFLADDSTTTLDDVARRLMAALDEARFGDRSFYLPRYGSEITDGFVLASQWEQTDKNGNPMPEPDRWAVKVTPSRDWSLSSILESLLGPNTGYFRVMVFFVTPNYIGQTDSLVNQETASDWTTEGAGFLPEEVGNELFASTNKAYFCTVYIYEFVQKTPDEKPIQRMQADGGLPARVHMEKSMLWSSLMENTQGGN